MIGRSLSPVSLVLALTTVSGVVFVWCAALDWPGAPNPCLLKGDCYCEAPRPGWIRQPANTWTCAGGPLVGLIIAWQAQRRRRRHPAPRTSNRMRSTLFFPGLYALVLTFSAIAPAFFHASLTDWAGKLDILSMYLFAGFWVAYNVTRLFDLSERRFMILYAVLTVVPLIPRVIFGVWGIEVFNLFIIGVVATEFWIRIPVSIFGLPTPRRLRVNRRWLWVALASYLPALLLWEFIGQGDRSLCDPYSLWQGHAAWHLLTGIPPICVYLYFRNGHLTEPSQPVPSTT